MEFVFKKILFFIVFFIFFGTIPHFAYATCTCSGSTGSGSTGTCSPSVSSSADVAASTDADDINQCIADLRSSGGTVTLSEGTFYVNSTIQLVSDFILMGSGKNSTTIQATSSSFDILSNNNSPISEVIIRDLTISGFSDENGESVAGAAGDGNTIDIESDADGDTDDDPTLPSCILIKSDEPDSEENSHIQVLDSQIQYCKHHGIHIRDTDGIYLRGLKLRHNGTSHSRHHNIYLRRVDNAKVMDSSSNRASGNGLNVSFSNNVVARDFKAKYNGQNGIRFAHSSYVKADDVTIKHSGYDSASETSENRCDLDDDLCNGIELRSEQDDNPATNNHVQYACIKDSHIYTSHSYWLHIESAEHYDTDGNTTEGENGHDNAREVSSTSSPDDNVCTDTIPSDTIDGWSFIETSEDDYESDPSPSSVSDDEMDLDDDGFESVSDGGSDCDDTATGGSIYPGASETCDDGVDQDCSGADLSCADVDYDGDGYSANQGDCDESTNGRNPGVPEICGDGTDQNCDGVDPSCDTDGDGITDAADTCPSTSPLDASDSVNASGCALSQLDSDGDSLTDYQETITYGTDPAVSDSDGDGLGDGSEVTNGTNPLSTDTDGDGMPDSSDPDPLVALDLTPVLELILSGDEDGDGEDSTDDGGTDCDDEDASVYSGATEVCGDGIDQDCSGSDTSCDSDGDGVNDVDEIAEGSDPNDATSTACILPTSETDWVITRDCKLFTAKTWAGDLYIQSAAIVTIPTGISLDMDFSLKKLMVQSGSGVLIEQGGTLH